MTDMPSEAELQAREERVRANAAASPASPEGPRCRHCGDPIRQGESGAWAHIVGPGSILYNCQHTAPYGQRAEPPEGPDEGLREPFVTGPMVVAVTGALLQQAQECGHAFPPGVEGYAYAAADAVLPLLTAERERRERAEYAVTLMRERGNEARERADRLAQVVERVEALIADREPLHAFDCDRFQTYDYNTRSGKCDCNVTADLRAALSDPEATP